MRWSGAVAGLVALAVLVPACSAGDGSARAPQVPGTTVAPLPVDDPAGPEYPLRVPRGRAPVVAEGDDWSMPGWARPAAYSGFFSEDASPADHIPVRSVDVSWAQVRPTEDGPLDLTSSGEAQGMFFDPLGEQLDQDGPYWVRMFSSGVDWAPEWVVDKCQVGAVGTDYDGQQHLPIWDDCVWTELSDTWRRLLVDQGLLDDPEFRFAYVPGGFTWSEYDYEMISAAVRRGELTQADYLAWYDRMLDDFVDLAGPRVGQLVFTGEDYPWGPFGRADDLLATRAVRRGLGVRTGITEEFNFHLNETPAYGSRVGPDGHLVLSRPEPEGLQVFGTENECYVDCGFSAQDPAYDVVQSNLKALQLQMNWVYVVPGASLLDPQARHWDWVRLSLGRTPEKLSGRVGGAAGRRGHVLARHEVALPPPAVAGPAVRAQPGALGGAGRRSRGGRAPLDRRRAPWRPHAGERRVLRRAADRPRGRRHEPGLPRGPALPVRGASRAGAGQGHLPRPGSGLLPAPPRRW